MCDAGTWSISHSRHLHLGSSSSAASAPVASGKEERRKSGDDILTQSSPSVQSPRKSTPTLFDAFRPRSKSDASRAKKPTTLIAQMKNVVQVCDSVYDLTNARLNMKLNNICVLSGKISTAQVLFNT